jgi:hypothetical protein
VRVHREDSTPSRGQLERAAPPPLSLQRAIGNRAVSALIARQLKPPTFSGSVFLPGEANIGHRFTVEGTNIVEGTGKDKRVVGSIDANGKFTLADGTTGNLADLTGQVTQKGGAKPGKIASTTGSGSFTLWDSEGEKHALTIKDGGVFAKVGKRQELVGDVDVGGHYRVKLDGHVLTGALTDYAVAVDNVALAKPGAQLQVGHEKVPEGILLLGDGTYTVKAGQLFAPGAKQPVGSVTMVRSGAKLEGLSLPLSYTRTVKSNDYTGFVVDRTDLAQHPPGAGSVLRLGKGDKWIVSDGSAWVDMTGTHVKKGFEIAGGGRVEDKLRALAAAKKITVTADEIELMQRISEVESGGHLEDINTYDSDVVSLGFIQYTLAGSLQELIEMAPDAFARYGIRLGPETTLKRSIGNVKVKGIEGVKDLQDLRKLEWAVKFFLAGLDPDVIAAQVKKAQAEFAEVTHDHLAVVSGMPLFQTPRVKAIIFELNNNRPAYVGATVRKTAAEAKKHPDWSQDDFVAQLQSVMEDEFVKNNKNNINGKTDAEAREKARHIVERAGHN